VKQAITHRIAFCYSFIDAVKYRLSRLKICFYKAREQLYKRQMKFKKSKEMLRKEFDIVTILKRMRKFTLLNNIMLTKG